MAPEVKEKCFSSYVEINKAEDAEKCDVFSLGLTLF
jgi:hypothetical protein